VVPSSWRTTGDAPGRWGSTPRRWRRRVGRAGGSPYRSHEHVTAARDWTTRGSTARHLTRRRRRRQRVADPAQKPITQAWRVEAPAPDAVGVGAAAPPLRRPRREHGVGPS
jgi:hypothetical protein